MDTISNWDIDLGSDRLKGRSFLLGNKRAFSLCLPVATGPSDRQLHPHKWFGAHLYGRKFLEAQVIRARAGGSEHLLTGRLQTGFTNTLTHAQRRYELEDHTVTETYFVPDGVHGFACTLTGEADLAIEPEFDLRLYGTLSQTLENYSVEWLDDAVVISNIVPKPAYDDAQDCFVSMDSNEDGRLYAAVDIVGEHVLKEELAERERSRRKLFRRDHFRRRFILGSSTEDAFDDHAPLWDLTEAFVYAPVRLYLLGHGVVVYGFGSTAEEALEQLRTLRDNLIAFEAQKTESAADLLERTRFKTGDQRVDKAHHHVLARFMDALVARHVIADDTALQEPATMILAGNQYFHDAWKRDENIALGILITLGFYDIARDVIRDTWQLQDPVTGRLPQRIRVGEAPFYHSSDGTLWALWRLYQYWRASGDESLLQEKLPMVRLFLRRSLKGTVDGLLPSGRGDESRPWETWMDTRHTPRHGFPIEIQMLWVACLRVFRPVIRKTDSKLAAGMRAAEAAAWQGLQRFQSRGLLADSLDEQGDVRDLITPNPYFCFGVGLDMGPEVERAMRDFGRRQLAGHQGIVTLAPQDWDRVFSADFLRDRRHVRGRRMRSVGKFNYHRGVEWNWLSQFFVQAELKFGEPDMACRKYLRGQIEAALEHAGIGGISELFDLSGTRGPEFQAWSMAGFLEALHAFAGIRVDVPSSRIHIEPQIPAHWPQIETRGWYGPVPFDVSYQSNGGRQQLRIEFPSGEPEGVELEISMLIPFRQTLASLLVQSGGGTHETNWRIEPIPGANRSRLRFELPASQAVNVVASFSPLRSRNRLTA